MKKTEAKKSRATVPLTTCMSCSNFYLFCECTECTGHVTINAFYCNISHTYVPVNGLYKPCNQQQD